MQAFPSAEGENEKNSAIAEKTRGGENFRAAQGRNEILNVFEEINSWSADEFASRAGLSLAKDGKTCRCPKCGKGEGYDGLHWYEYNGAGLWRCFGTCGKSYNNVGLAIVKFGLENCEKSEQAKRLAAELGLPDDFQSARAKKSARVGDGGKKMASKTEAKNYANFYERCRKNVEKFLDEHGGSYRGLTRATFEKYGLGIAPEFGTTSDVQKVPALIMPSDDFHFAARKLVDVEGNQKLTRHGRGGLFVASSIDKAKTIYFVEGEIDAMSIAQVLGDRFGIVATGGASNYRKVLTVLEKKFPDVVKPKCIVAFDNDTGDDKNPGKTNGERLVAELRAAGFPAVSCYFNGDDEPKIDANDLLQRGEDELRNWLEDFYQGNFEDLERQADEFKKAALERAELERRLALEKSGLRVSPFAEYFSKDFFGEIDLTAKFSERATGFANLDAAQVLMPGLYVLGALPATGKTTFCWQLLNQLAEKGETCIYCSYEMSRLELFAKSITRKLFLEKPELSRRLNLTSANIRRGAGRNLPELLEVVKTCADSTKHNLYVVEASNKGVCGLLGGLKPILDDAETSPVIAIDYLQIIPGEVKTVGAKDKIDDVILRLKDFQRETNSTLLVISSFNRENYFRPITFSSFKESGAIEYSADVIWGLENYGIVIDEDTGKKKLDQDAVIEMSRQPVRLIKFACLKNRNGSAYECFFSYDAAHDNFSPCKDEDEYFDARDESKHDDEKKYIR